MGTKWKALSALDFTLSRPGFLRGDRLIKMFSPFLKGIETFDQLQLPCRTVATDIESGERVTIQSGRLDMAFRASSSVPMVWAPVVYQGRVLVDGAVVDPVPAEVVRDMGADICIAVNVVPPLEKGVDTILSRLYRQANRLNPLSYLSKERNLPNLFDIIMNTIQSLQYELGNFKAISADVRINPDLSGYTWIDFYKPMEIIEKGTQAAKQALPEIRRTISERLSVACR
jgi:NTE family protein